MQSPIPACFLHVVKAGSGIWEQGYSVYTNSTKDRTPAIADCSVGA